MPTTLFSYFKSTCISPLNKDDGFAQEIALQFTVLGFMNLINAQCLISCHYTVLLVNQLQESI